ncbi:MAG: sugar ABC transporter permease [Anaerolineae bacterium]|nr:sugar ABC transporter permease [Anaerolineae bacterium]
MENTRMSTTLSPETVQHFRAGKWLSLAFRYGVVVILILFAVVPAIWVISASLNPAKSLGSGSIFVQDPSLINYQQLLENPYFPYMTWFRNSLKIASITTAITVFITCLAGYTLSRFRFQGRRGFMIAILILNVFPSILAMVAIFTMMQQLSMYIDGLGLDTHASLILIYTAGSMGINVLMVKAYIDTIPIELDESALVDGATPWQTFRHITLPIMRPIAITIGVLTFIASYGDFVIARVLLKSSEKLTVMVGLMLFQTDRFDQDFGMITAGAVLAAIPVILLYIPLQGYVIDGLTAGSVKG